MPYRSVSLNDLLETMPASCSTTTSVPIPTRATPITPTRTFEDLKTALLQYGFLTGSRAFGGFRPDSDWDIAYLGIYRDEVNALLTGVTLVPSNYFSGSHLEIEGNSINIIPLHQVDFLPWYLATKAMKGTFSVAEIHDRTKKHAVFMGIVSLFKAVLSPMPEDGNWYRELLAKVHFDVGGRNLNDLF